MTNGKIRVVIADDQNMLRDALATMLSVEPDIEVVGEAANGVEACHVAVRVRPDIVLMDVQMPVLDGIEATRRIQRELPDVKVLILTTFDVDEYIIDGLKAGAIGYILKSFRRDQLIQAIHTVARGESVLHPAVATKVINTVRSTHVQPSVQILTRQEHAILRLVAQAYSNQEIADRLDISEATVKSHMTRILAKLDAPNRNEAVERARTQNLL